MVGTAAVLVSCALSGGPQLQPEIEDAEYGTEFLKC